MKKLNEYELREKKILIRVDLNVPVIDGVITEKSRIHSIKLTIKKLQKQKNKIFLISHFGRPKGKRNNKYSLKFICDALKEELNLSKIYFLDNIKDKNIQNVINEMLPCDVCLFENIRFYPEEEECNLNFIKNLAKNFDAFVNEAFSASHRNHASIVGITKFLPSFAGINLIEEIKNIDPFISNFKKPNLAIIGGSKISSKIDLLINLIEKCDTIVIGGAMANTFLYAKGIDVGISVCEKNLSANALSIIDKAINFNCKIILPIDVVCADNLNDQLNIRKCNIKNIFSNQMVLDVGNDTTEIIKKYILKSRMVMWNGPLGAFEYKPFNQSSADIAKVISKYAKSLDISVIAGGGDTISVIKQAKAEEGFSYISKAGGAFLEWLEGNKSPGIIALENNYIN